MLFAVDIVFSLIVVIVRHIAVQVNFDPISCQRGSLISSASEIEEQVAIPQLAHEDGPTETDGEERRGQRKRRSANRRFEEAENRLR